MTFPKRSDEMGERPLRYQRSMHYNLASNRCFQSQELIPTDPDSIALILGAMGRYAKHHQITIYAYSILPHGFWILMTAEKANRQDFMRDFQSWVASHFNLKLDRDGKFFHERYDDQDVEDPEMLADIFVDVLVAPLREAFADNLETYGAATSFQTIHNDESIVGKWIDRDRLRSLRRSDSELPEEACANFYHVDITEPPREDLLGDGELELGEDQTVAEWLDERVLERAEKILEWQEDVDTTLLKEMRSEPHGAPRLANPLEPLGPPKYRYSLLCRTYIRERLLAYDDARERKRSGYSGAMKVWRGVDQNVKKPSDDHDHTIADGGQHYVMEHPALLFPTSTIPPGWTKTRGPLDPHPHFGSNGGGRNSRKGGENGGLSGAQGPTHGAKIGGGFDPVFDP